MKLSDRLETILNILGTDNDILADIGTDHGFTAIEAVRRRIAKRAIACDIGMGPLNRAREHIAEAKLTDKIETRLADGLLGLSENEADAIVVSGMGGGLICKILDEGKDRISSETKLVLSPQSELSEFRKWIISNGFSIERETIVFDEGKYYFIILVTKRSCKSVYKDYEFAYGKKGLFSEDALAVRTPYIKNEISVKTGIFEKLSMDISAHHDRLNELKNEIELAKASLI